MSGGDEGIAFLSFSEQGAALAERLREALGGTTDCAHGAEGFSLTAWTREAFARRRALVFVGAAGIAVRAVAPYLQSKADDPAVVAVDERGRFAVALVSGHLGGANDLAHAVAAVCGAVPVVTTATDVNGRFAVDAWARQQDCAVLQPWRIKKISAKVLEGKTISVHSEWLISGTPPEQVRLAEDAADVEVGLYQKNAEALCLTPRIAVLGIGCRRGTSQETLEKAFAALCKKLHLWEAAVFQAATIDCKAGEPGLSAFCAAHNWRLRVFPAEALRQVEGDFTASAFVEETVGVDNVCERSAVLAAGGPLLEKKNAGGGVTLALAQRPYKMDWRWRDG